jgi:uncharacterized protein YlbG (UPF0298 family)
VKFVTHFKGMRKLQRFGNLCTISLRLSFLFLCYEWKDVHENLEHALQCLDGK